MFLALLLLLLIAADESNTDPITWKNCPKENTTLREGFPGVIKCEANIDSEMPNVNGYRWDYRKSESIYSRNPLLVSSKYLYNAEATAKVGDLRIRSVDRDDTGQQLLCLRGPLNANRLTRCNHVTTLRVLWVNPIVSVRQLQPDRPPHPADDLRLTCHVEAAEKPTIVRWYFNGMLIEPKEGVLISGSELTVKNLSYANMGHYHCFVKVVNETIFSREPLAVLPEDLASFFGPPVIYAKVGSPDDGTEPDVVELKAEVPFSSMYSVSWYALTRIGQQASKKNIGSDPNTQRNGNNLQFKSDSWRKFVTEMQLPDSTNSSGHYFMCHVLDLQAKQMGYYVYEVVAAQVPKLSQAASFEPPLSQVRIVKRGSEFVQRVYPTFGSQLIHTSAVQSASGWSPLPVAVWKDPSGLTVKAEAPHGVGTPRMSVFRNYSLRIRDAQPADSGVYELLLSNKAGRVPAQLHLLVAAPPMLNKGLRNLTAEENSKILIDCLQPGDFVSPPPATVFSWYRLGAASDKIPQLVATSSAGDSGGSSDSSLLKLPPQQASVNAETGVLMISRLSAEASGSYVCLAVTRLNEPEVILDKSESASAQDTSGPVQLKVIKLLRICPSLLATLFMEVGTQQVVDCPWFGEAQPQISWFRVLPDGTRQSLLSSIGLEFSNNNTKLTLHLVDWEHNGSYVIRASSPTQGVVEKDFSIVVGRRPVIELLSPNRTVLAGSSVWLDCRATGTPPPLISWTLQRPGVPDSVIYDQERSRPDGKRRVELHGNGSLLIRDVSLSDVGNYQCLAGHSFFVAQAPMLTLQLAGGVASDGVGDGPSGGAESMSRTIAIVVSCAVGYLFLIVFLSVFCTLRMQRLRRKRRDLDDQTMDQEAAVAAVAAASTDSRQSPALSQQLLNSQQRSKSRPYRQQQSPSHSSSPVGGASGQHLKAGGVFQLQQRQDSCYETAPSSGGGGQEFRPLLTQPQHPMQPFQQQPLDSRSLNSDISYGSNSFNRLHTNTPANSVAESTLDRLARMHPLDRRLLVYGTGILGRGLFGQVRTASLNGQQVLVKELTSTAYGTRTEFTDQVKLFSRCSHDSVTRLVGLCLDAGPTVDCCPVMVLEYCENGNLYNRLVDMRNRGQQLPLATQLRMCRQAALALQHLHSLGFVHCDVGCRNLLVSSDDNVKLTNLGPCLDRFCGQYGQSPSGHLLPLRWMPPEALVRDQFGIKTDIWSLGVTVGEVFTAARLPMPLLASDADVLAAASAAAAAQLTAPTVEAAAAAAAAAGFWPVPSVEALQAAVPAVRSLIERCCCPAPDRRPTAAQLAGQLADIMRMPPPASANC